MIRRIDRIATELPPPSDPDPAGAAAVQELMGGRFGEMSTFLNYTFQSFNFRNRRGARPFYDLVANIAAEEFGHVELVAAAINTMLTGASPTDDGRAPKASLAPLKGIGNPHHFLAGGQGALPQNSQGRPWNGDYVFSSGDLVEDLTHNFFLETGARNNKLKVYEMVEHPAARAPGWIPARARRRPPGRLRSRARAPDRRRSDEALPHAAHPGQRRSLECMASPARRPPAPVPVLAQGLPGAHRRVHRPASGDGRGARRRRRGAGGRASTCPRSRRCSHPTTRRRRSRRSRSGSGSRRASPTSRPARWRTGRSRSRPPGGVPRRPASRGRPPRSRPWFPGIDRRRRTARRPCSPSSSSS